MPYVIFVRHGESEANVSCDNPNAEYKSDPHDSPLTKLGKLQAIETGKFLQQNFRIKKIYSSPYLRCQETTKLINGNLGVPVVTDDLLHEISHGKLNGLKMEKYNKMPFAAKVNKLYRRLAETITHHFFKKKHETQISAIYTELHKTVGFETIEQTKVRCKKIIKKYIRRNADGDILICAHRGVIMLLLAEYCNLYEFAIPDSYGCHSNCSVTVFNMDKQGRIDMFLYTKHLDGLQKKGGNATEITASTAFGSSPIPNPYSQMF